MKKLGRPKSLNPKLFQGIRIKKSTIEDIINAYGSYKEFIKEAVRVLIRREK